MNKEIFKKEDFIFWEYYPTKCQYVGIIKDYYYTNSRYPSYRIDYSLGIPKNILENIMVIRK